MRNTQQGGNRFAVVIIVLLIGISIAVLAINGAHLSDREYTCVRWGISNVCTAYTYGCMITEDFNDGRPCDYAYSVGAISLFVQIIALVIQSVSDVQVWGTVTSIFDLIWWAVAGSYFTKKWEEADDLPLDDWRHALMALCWTAVSLSAVWVLVSIAMCANARKSAYQAEGERPQQNNQGVVFATYVPAAPAAPYPAPAAGYPAPPPPGYPAGYPGAYPAAYPAAYPTGYPAGYPTPQPAAYPAGYPAPQPGGYPTAGYPVTSPGPHAGAPPPPAAGQ